MIISISGISAPSPPVGRLPRRAVLRILGGSLALALASRPLVGPVVKAKPARFDPARLASPVAYRGTATTTILASGADAGGRTRSAVERDVTVTVAPPSDGESAPFDLRVDAATGRRVEGADHLTSSGVAFDAAGAESVVQFWDLRTDGDRVRGTLRDPAGDAAPGYNVLNTFREFVPGVPDTLMLATESMVGGTALRGRITETDLELAVSANTLNAFAGDALNLSRAFRCTVRATRVGTGGGADSRRS